MTEDSQEEDAAYKFCLDSNSANEMSFVMVTLESRRSISLRTKMVAPQDPSIAEPYHIPLLVPQFLTERREA
jgi:hypothetical protein